MVRVEGLRIAKAHMSPVAFWCTVAFVVLTADIPLVSILRTGDWTKVSTSARHYFSTYITTMDWHQDLFQFTVLGLREKVTCW